jgi:multidrug efflux pump
MGLTRKVVANSLYANLNGYTVSEYYERDQAIDVVFRLDKKDRKSLDEVQNLSIATSSGAVPLSQVADISYESENNMIWHRDLQPTITVNGAIGEGATGNDVSADVWESMKDIRSNLPAGVKIEVGGPHESSIKALNYLLNPMPVMAVVMLILMMLQMQDLRKLFCVLCTAPMCITGIALGLLLFNAPMGIMAEIGSFALIGTVIRNSMVILDQIHLHIEAGMDDRTAVLESAIVRFRPIMLAALTTIFGLVPMFASPFWNALAIAMACGLTGATALTLLFLPTLYAIVYKIPEKAVKQ